MAAQSPIDKSLKRFTGLQLAALQDMAAILRDLLPTATEDISWNMPAFKIDGVGVACIEGFKDHNSLFPMSGSVPATLAVELSGYAVTKGTIHFALDKSMPKPLVRKIVQARIAEINASYPKKNGEYKEFYDNGVLKAAGRMKHDAMTGQWRWYRRDGSRMRTGAFARGEQVGEWVTYAADGRVVKRTQMGKATARPAKKAATRPAGRRA